MNLFEVSNDALQIAQRGMPCSSRYLSGEMLYSLHVLRSHAHFLQTALPGRLQRGLVCGPNSPRGRFCWHLGQWRWVSFPVYLEGAPVRPRRRKPFLLTWCITAPSSTFSLLAIECNTSPASYELSASAIWSELSFRLRALMGIPALSRCHLTTPILILYLSASELSSASPLTYLLRRSFTSCVDSFFCFPTYLGACVASVANAATPQSLVWQATTEIVLWSTSRRDCAFMSVPY